MERPLVLNLDPMFNDLKMYIEEHQGEKGYIDTQECSMKDTIFGFMYNEDLETFEESVVYGVRVKDDDIEIILEHSAMSYNVEYTDEDFKNAEWVSLRWSDVLYIQTLFNIAENIEEYA